MFGICSGFRAMSEHTESLKVWRCKNCGGVEGASEGRCAKLALCRKRGAEEVEVIPADSPQVLSPEEVRLVVDRLGIGRTPEEMEGAKSLWKRLSEWAGGGEQ
jgi:hypothetical protein